MTSTYQYQAFLKSGEESNGVVAAENENDARSQLAKKNLIIISLVEKANQDKGINKSIRFGRKKLNANALSWLARNLATSQSSGLPIFASLAMFAKQKAGTPTGEMLSRVHKKVGDGSSISRAMRDEQDMVGELTCAFIEAGEVSGKLEESFSKLADITENRAKIKRKVKSAAMYPIVVLGIALMMSAGILIGVVPKFEEIYNELDGELPMITRFVIFLSDTAIKLWFVYPFFIFGCVFTVMYSLKKPKVLKKVHTYSLKLPLFGSLLKKAAFARLTSVLASLLGSGVGLLESIEFAGKASGNLYVEEMFQRAYKQIKDGRSFSESLRLADAEVFIQLVTIGEETGQLSPLMERYANTLDDEVSTAVDGLTALMEPLLIVVLGVVIGGLVFSFWLPMLNAPGLIQDQG